VHKADNLVQSCAVVTKSGNRKVLEPLGPLRACNGISLPFTLIIIIIIICFTANGLSPGGSGYYASTYI